MTSNSEHEAHLDMRVKSHAAASGWNGSLRVVVSPQHDCSSLSDGSALGGCLQYLDSSPQHVNGWQQTNKNLKNPERYIRHY